MTCPLQEQETALLLDYSAGRLDAASKALVERHMATCPDCASLGQSQAALWNALDRWEPAPVSMDFNRQLWQRIDAAASAPWYKKIAGTLQLSHWKAAVPLTAALILMAAGFLFDHPAGKSSVRGVSIREADQVEQALDDIELLHQLDAVAPPASARSKTM